MTPVDPAVRRRRGLITIVVMMATIMHALDGTIANVALPSIQGSLSATQEQVSWVVTSYIVASAILTPLAGFCAMRFGLRRTLATCVIGFTIVSMLCGAAQTLDQLVLFRALQRVVENGSEIVGAVARAGAGALAHLVLVHDIPPVR